MSAGAIKAGDAYVELGTRMGAMWRKGLAAAQQRLSAWGSKLTRIGLVGVGAFAVAAKFAAKQEEADVRLAAALDRVGVAGRKALPGLKAFASEIQAVTVHGDELVEGAMTKMINISGASGDALKKMTIAAIGLAEAYDMDLATASMLVGRAMKGQTQTLARYGIQLDTTASKEDQFNELLKIGAGQFALAEARAKTASGRFAQMKNALGDAAEKIGEALLPALSELFSWLVKIAAPVQAWIKDNAEMVVLAAKLAAGILAVGVSLKILAGLLAVVQSGTLLFIALAGSVVLLLEAFSVVDIGFTKFVGGIRIGTFKIATWFNAVTMAIGGYWEWLLAQIQIGWEGLTVWFKAITITIRSMWESLIAWLLKAWYNFLNEWTRASGWIAKQGLKLLGMGDVAQEIDRMQKERDKRLQGKVGGVDRAAAAEQKKLDKERADLQARHLKRLADIEAALAAKQKARAKEMEGLFGKDLAEKKAADKAAADRLKAERDKLKGQLADAMKPGKIAVPGLAAAIKARIDVVGTFRGGIAPLKIAAMSPAVRVAQQQVGLQKLQLEQQQLGNQVLGRIHQQCEKIPKGNVAVLGAP